MHHRRFTDSRWRVNSCRVVIQELVCSPVIRKRPTPAYTTSGKCVLPPPAVGTVQLVQDGLDLCCFSPAASGICAELNRQGSVEGGSFQCLRDPADRRRSSGHLHSLCAGIHGLVEASSLRSKSFSRAGVKILLPGYSQTERQSKLLLLPFPPQDVSRKCISRAAISRRGTRPSLVLLTVAHLVFSF